VRTSDEPREFCPEFRHCRNVGHFSVEMALCCQSLRLAIKMLYFKSALMHTKKLTELEQRQTFREGATSMSADAMVVKNLMKQNLLGVFNERDGAKRVFMIAKLWDAKAIFIDPEGRWVGHQAINDAAEQLQHRFPDFAFSELADPDVNSGVGRLPWGFGPPAEPRKITGIDVMVTSDDGRISALYTFLDAVKG